jgi:glycerol-3-phosphate dehydrogenase (NAD(P)+)
VLTKATVVGTGAMGTVVAQILADNGVHVALLAKSPERAREIVQIRENHRYLPGHHLSDRITTTANAAAALAATELIVSAIPCQYLREVWTAHGRHVSPDAPIVSVTKGLEIGTMHRPSEILAELAPDAVIAALSGPNIAPEMARCLPATAVVASPSAEVCRLVQEVMSTSWFRIYTNPDMLGVELAGAVKNVVAIAAGILDGLQAGDNAKSALVTRGLVEISRLGEAMGARPDTFTGLAGIGDLVTTCISPLGRNRSAGERIGRGESPDEIVRSSESVIEGIPTTRSVLKLAEARGVEMPIVQAVYDVLFDHKEPLQAITELMCRPPKAERPHGGD